MRWLPLLVIVGLTGIVAMRLVHHQRSVRSLASQLLILSYFAGLGIILFTPISFDGSAVYVMPAGYGQVNLTRLSLMNVGFVENIILTVPLGLLMKRAFPNVSLITIGIIGLMIGSSIEITQYYMSQYWLINRSSDINDVLANGTGVSLGGSVMAVVQRTFMQIPLKSRSKA